MARGHDEYEEHAPRLAEFAALDPDDPRRVPLRRELVAAHLPLARHIARRFAHRGEPVDDLEQVASIGLMHALERFDPGRERSFLSYAVPTIMGEVRRHFRDSTWAVHTPRGVKDRYLAVGSATTRLAHRLGRAPTTAEIAGELDLDRREVEEAVAAHGSLKPASLDAAVSGTAEMSDALVDTLAVTDPDFAHVEHRAVVGDLVRQLPERERTILVLRFVHDKTQSEIGAELHISQMHVSRLLGRTLALLRERLDGGAERDEAPVTTPAC